MAELDAPLVEHFLAVLVYSQDTLGMLDMQDIVANIDPDRLSRVAQPGSQLVGLILDW